MKQFLMERSRECEKKPDIGKESYGDRRPSDDAVNEGVSKLKASPPPRELFLWSMTVVYLVAFTSLFVQIPGLSYGDYINSAELFSVI